MTAFRMSEHRTSLIGALLAALGPISMAMYTPAMPELVRAFGTTDPAIKMSLSLYFAGFAVAQLLSGPMSDAFGRRKASITFLSIYLAGSFVAAYAPTIEWLLAGRLVQGIGASVGITVARAIVRDQFVGDQASRIMNMIGIMLAVGPAMAPTLGGLALAAFGWQSVFFLMVGFGMLACSVSVVFLKETSVPDRRRARPGFLASAYAALARDGRFLSASLVIGGSVGALYTQSTMLPFILIDEVGLTPTQFGMGMLMQSGSYFFGSVFLRFVAPRLSGENCVRIGLLLIGAGAVMVAVSAHLIEPSFLSIMLPVAIATMGIAFVTPHMTTAGLFPFPHIAGSASALMGFIQMGSGFGGGVVAALVGHPLLAFGTVIPTMGLVSILGYVWYMQCSRRAAALEVDHD
ncbi:multidrug effflux MFS transporter [Ferirhizobium litorale]|uniref:Bcr/CflA family efflux transporter n=1 Tax=Ferirhizobium litorale TaxID=2927786 RepID=A0AAE3QIA9_9HYPH|nr:multidrug effflux MFS transporter [Fererhizobium litorale]MDI7923674.1 multidrug effflux MFS transporter [Fererhizobium litorale]